MTRNIDDVYESTDQRIADLEHDVALLLKMMNALEKELQEIKSGNTSVTPVTPVTLAKPSKPTAWHGIQLDRVRKIQCQISYEPDLLAKRSNIFSVWWIKLEIMQHDGSTKVIDVRTEPVNKFLGTGTRSKSKKYGDQWTDETRAFFRESDPADQGHLLGFIRHTGDKLCPNQLLALTNHLDPADDPHVTLMIDGQRIDMGPFRPTKMFTPEWRHTGGSYVLFASWLA